mgnify:CR=1 FL=1
MKCTMEKITNSSAKRSSVKCISFADKSIEQSYDQVLDAELAEESQENTLSAMGPTLNLTLDQKSKVTSQHVQN